MSELIVPLGSFEHERGLQICDKDELERVFKNLQGREMIVDYHHISFERPDFDKAGTLLPDTLELREDGIYGEFDWTGVYRGFYLSPVFLFDEVKSTPSAFHILSLEGLGLTDNPNIASMRKL